jgi:glutathione S-transferase
MGRHFTVADGYLFVMPRWAGRNGINLSDRKNLAAFKARSEARPKVQEALTREA